MADGFLIGESLLTRIRASVDVTEKAIRKEEPYRIPTRLEGGEGAVATGKAIRMGKFSGAWPKGATHSVALYAAGGGTQVVTATNFMASMAVGCGWKRCFVTQTVVPTLANGSLQTETGTQTAWTLLSVELA